MTAHGNLHTANLTTATPQLLDQERFGLAPSGYDAAMLLAYSLLAPGFAQRVRDTFPVLETDLARRAGPRLEGPRQKLTEAAHTRCAGGLGVVPRW
ncbi:hypothetical protein ACFCYB_11615 [Streptomyces sp. NPDC056309]|uniref:hypothetical protein n=1 Tax=unclassified Streptomyces TaxID=2593676 RepID=UPI0035DAA367